MIWEKESEMLSIANEAARMPKKDAWRFIDHQVRKTLGYTRSPHRGAARAWIWDIRRDIEAVAND